MIESKQPSRTQNRWIALSATTALLLICAILQRHSGAYSSDLAGHSDEPAHVVTGLMVYDYLGHLLRPGASRPSSPRAFAESYYVHYPKVAIGRWPPLFYLIQAIWMFAFGETKAALLVLMLVTTAATAALLFHVMQEINGAFAAFIMATAFLLFPISQQSLFAVMPDALLALLFCAATAVGGGALEGRPRWWIAYGVLTVTAILVHGRGVVLILVPWIAILLAGKIGLFKHRALWIPSVVALLLILTWMHFFRQTGRLSIAALVEAATAFPLQAFQCLGPVFFSLTVLGAITARYRAEPRWAFVTGVLLGTWGLFSIAIVPWDDRYLTPALPACVVLAACGLSFLARIAAALRLPPPVTVTALVMLAAAASLMRALPLMRKPDLAYESLVGEILKGPDGDKLVYLVAGDAIHEGDFIASLAMREPAAKHIVLRSTKAFAKTDWPQSVYEPFVQSTAAMAAFLKESWISLVIIQEGGVRPDLDMLRTTMPDSGWLRVPAPAGTLVYRRTTPLPPGEITIRIDMRRKLGKYLTVTP